MEYKSSSRRKVTVSFGPVANRWSLTTGTYYIDCKLGGRMGLGADCPPLSLARILTPLTLFLNEGLMYV